MQQIPQLNLSQMSKASQVSSSQSSPSIKKPSSSVHRVASYGRSLTQEENAENAPQSLGDKIMIDTLANERRRGSMVENRTDANNELV